MNVLLEWIQRFLGSIEGENPSGLQLAVLRVIFVGIWVAIGLLAGAVVAFFVFLIAGSASGNAWPALISFGLVAISATLYGLYVAIFLMSNRNRK